MCAAEGEPYPARVINRQTRQGVLGGCLGAALGRLIRLAGERALRIGIVWFSIKLTPGYIRPRRRHADQILINRLLKRYQAPIRLKRAQPDGAALVEGNARAG